MNAHLTLQPWRNTRRLFLGYRPPRSPSQFTLQALYPSIFAIAAGWLRGLLPLGVEQGLSYTQPSQSLHYRIAPFGSPNHRVPIDSALNIAAPIIASCPQIQERRHL